MSQAVPVHPVSHRHVGGLVEGVQLPLELQFWEQRGVSQLSPDHPTLQFTVHEVDGDVKRRENPVISSFAQLSPCGGVGETGLLIPFCTAPEAGGAEGA